MNNKSLFCGYGFMIDHQRDDDEMYIELKLDTEDPLYEEKLKMM